MRRIFPVLRNADFARLWGGSVISMFGSSLMFIALPLLAWDRAGTASAFAAVFIAEGFAVIIAGLFGGSLADRLDRRRMILIGDACELALVLALVIVVAEGWWAPIPFIAFGIQLAGSTFGSAFSALRRDLLTDDQRQAGNSLQQLGVQMANLTAPLAGAVIYQQAGMAPILIINAASYVASIVLVTGIRYRAPAPRGASDDDESRASATRVWTDLAVAVSLVRRDRAITMLLGKFVILSIANGALFVALMPWIVDDIGAAPALFGIFVTVLGGSGLAAALVLARVGDRFSPASLLSIALVPMVVGSVIVAIPTVPTFLLCGLLFGMVDVPLNVAAATLVQRRFESGVQGRIGALMMLVTQVPRTIAMLAFAPIVDTYGGQPMMLTWTAGVLLAAVVQVMIIRELRSEAGSRSPAFDPGSDPSAIRRIRSKAQAAVEG